MGNEVTLSRTHLTNLTRMELWVSVCLAQCPLRKEKERGEPSSHPGLLPRERFKTTAPEGEPAELGGLPELGI